MVLADGIVVQQSPKGTGNCLIATKFIPKGGRVWWEDNTNEPEYATPPKSWAYIQALPKEAREVFMHFVYQTGPDEYQSLPEFDELPFDKWPSVVSRDPSMYMNHSCDPTCWFTFPKGDPNYPEEMVATRDIHPGDEVTFDYAMTEMHDQPWTCLCGTKLCRKNILGTDWQRPELQERYRGHFLGHVQMCIDGKWDGKKKE